MLILYSFFFFLFYTRSHQKEKQAKEKGKGAFDTKVILFYSTHICLGTRNPAISHSAEAPVPFPIEFLKESL